MPPLSLIIHEKSDNTARKLKKKDLSYEAFYRLDRGLTKV